MLHLSNRSLDLVPVVARLADELGLVGFVAESNPNQMELADGALASTWAAVGRSPADLAGLAARSMWAPLAQQRQSSLWTDDRVDLLGALTLR